LLNCTLQQIKTGVDMWILILNIIGSKLEGCILMFELSPFYLVVSKRIRFSALVIKDIFII